MTAPELTRDGRWHAFHNAARALAGPTTPAQRAMLLRRIARLSRSLLADIEKGTQ